ncbi:olfactory receptor 1G1-like [Lissotriton helveticus]
MKEENQSSIKDFLIVGFLDLPQLQVPLWAAFSVIYLSILVGNLVIMATIHSKSQLHTPMYFFLTNLSFTDICYTSVIFPQMLAHYFMGNTHVSFTACLMQVYFFMFFVFVEYILLSVMAFDRYVAVCNPLRYLVIMNKSVCFRLAVGTWAVSSLVPLPHTVLLSHFSFCKSHTINHFFCDLSALMKISCSNTHTIETLTYIIAAVVAFFCFNLIIISYVKIASSIFKIKSKGGKHKAFSTCASHLTVVVIFFGSLLGTYVRPTSTYSMRDTKISSLSYIALTPLCNPIIYSLKNTEFKNALRKKKNTL